MSVAISNFLLNQQNNTTLEWNNECKMWNKDAVENSNQRKKVFCRDVASAKVVFISLFAPMNEKPEKKQLKGKFLTERKWILTEK